MRHLDPFRRKTLRLVPSLSFHQIVVGEHSHADAQAFRRAVRLLQHQAVVAGFLKPAQIHRVAILFSDDQADQLGVEMLARRKIPHRHDDVARPRDVERRMEYGLGDMHGRDLAWRLFLSAPMIVLLLTSASPKTRYRPRARRHCAAAKSARPDFEPNVSRNVCLKPAAASSGRARHAWRDRRSQGRCARPIWPHKAQDQPAPRRHRAFRRGRAIRRRR